MNERHEGARDATAPARPQDADGPISTEETAAVDELEEFIAAKVEEYTRETTT